MPTLNCTENIGKRGIMAHWEQIFQFPIYVTKKVSIDFYMIKEWALLNHFFLFNGLCFLLIGKSC